MRRLATWSALIVPAWLVMIFCCLNAPIVFDMWTPYFWHRDTAADVGAAWSFAVENYHWNNPRLGQLLTVGVSLPPWSAVVMPVIDLALCWLGASLALGRVASLRRPDDALVTLVFAGILVACAPAIGPMLFYAPYTVNYVVGAVLALAFLLPYRAAPATARRWYAPAMLVLGAAAGMCNEHTPPAIGLLALVGTIAGWRRMHAEGGDSEAVRRRAWMVAGLVGFAAGAAALYLAPGQHTRYGGLANQHTSLELVTSRGFSGAWQLVRSFLGHLASLLPWALLAVAAHLRSRRADETRSETWRVPLALTAAAFVIVMTLLGSPKLGDRLLFAPVVLVCVAMTDVLVRQLRSRVAWAIAAALAALVLGYTGVRCVRAYRVLGPESAARLAALSHAPHDSVLELHALSVPDSRYSIGEDLDEEPHRSSISARFGLALIRLVP